MGNEDAGPGIMGLAMKELFERMEVEKSKTIFDVSVSCLEVYNETIRYSLLLFDCLLVCFLSCARLIIAFLFKKGICLLLTVLLLT